MRNYLHRILALLSFVLAGCATYPDNVSYLYGERIHRANIHTYSTAITAVDGRATMTHSEPVIVEPGLRVIQLATAPAAGFRMPETRELHLQVEPCKRYYIVAERGNRLQKDWHPVIDHVESTGGSNCR